MGIAGVSTLNLGTWVAQGVLYTTLLVCSILQLLSEKFNNIPKQPKRGELTLKRKIINIRWSLHRLTFLCGLLGTASCVDLYGSLDIYPRELVSLLQGNIVGLCVAGTNLACYIAIRLSFSRLKRSHPVIRFGEPFYTAVSIIPFISSNTSIGIRWAKVSTSTFWTSSLNFGVHALILASSLIAWDYAMWKLMARTRRLRRAMSATDLGSAARSTGTPSVTVTGNSSASRSFSTKTTEQVVIRFRRLLIVGNLVVVVLLPGMVGIAVRRALNDRPYEYPDPDSSELDRDLYFTEVGSITVSMIMLWFSWTPLAPWLCCGRCSRPAIRRRRLSVASVRDTSHSGAGVRGRAGSSSPAAVVNHARKRELAAIAKARGQQGASNSDVSGVELGLHVGTSRGDEDGDDVGDSRTTVSDVDDPVVSRYHVEASLSSLAEEENEEDVQSDNNNSSIGQVSQALSSSTADLRSPDA